MLDTLEYYTELARYNPPGPQTWRARDYYLQGKMAMFFYSTYIMDDLALAESAANSLTDKNFPELRGSFFDPQLVDNTEVVTAITGTQSAGYGVIVALGIMDNVPLEQKEAVQKIVSFMYEQSSYITFIHMSPGGMSPVLNDISRIPEYLNDPKGIFRRYGQEKLERIITGLDSIESFATINGKTFPGAGRIYAKKIIPRMIYSVTIEGEKPQDALARAEKEMKEVIGE
jgi:multiple sugar transport system substrate-binding protein